MTGTITRITEVANEEIEYRIKISKMPPSKIFMFLITPSPPFLAEMLKYKKLIANIYSNALKKGKGKMAKSKYSRT